MKKTIKMPKLSANMESGVLVSINKQAGESIKKGDVIFEVETEKVVSEIESVEEGTLVKIFFQEGDSIKADENLAEIEMKNSETGTGITANPLSFTKVGRFDGGKVELKLDVNGEIIENCNIYGDFFGTLDTEKKFVKY